MRLRNLELIRSPVINLAVHKPHRHLLLIPALRRPDDRHVALPPITSLNVHPLPDFERRREDDQQLRAFEILDVPIVNLTAGKSHLALGEISGGRWPENGRPKFHPILSLQVYCLTIHPLVISRLLPARALTHISICFARRDHHL